MLDVVTESFIWCILFKRRTLIIFSSMIVTFIVCMNYQKSISLSEWIYVSFKKIVSNFFVVLCFVRWFCSVFMYKLTGKLWLWNILKIMCLGYKELFNYVYKNIFNGTLQVHCVECCYEIPFRNLKLSQDKQYYIWKL